MRAIRHWMLTAIIFAACGCYAFADQPLKLGSGNTVEILSVGPLHSTAGWSALALKYRTQTPLSDLATLRKEVDEIWDRFVVDAERGGYKSAVISANEPTTGIAVTTNKSYNFVFEKRDGSWRTLEARELQQTKLNADFMKEFMARIDAAFTYNRMNALLLYMANDWTVTVLDPSDSKAESQTLDRMKFVKETYSAFAVAKNRHHTRDILNIIVSEDRLNAQVESRETEEITVNVQTIAGSAKTTDRFELKDGVVLWSKSNSVIEKRTITKSN